MNNNLNTLAPDFIVSMKELHGSMMILALAVIFISIMLVVYKSMVAGQLALSPFITVAIIGLLTVLFPTGIVSFGNLIAEFIYDEMGINHGDFSDLFSDLISGYNNAQQDKSFWDTVTNPNGAISESLMTLVFFLSGMIAELVVFYAQIIQQFIIYTSIGLSPLIFAMYLFEPTKNVCVQFVTGLVGLLFWPLGWAMVQSLVSALIDKATDTGLLQLTGGQYVYTASYNYFVLGASIFTIFGMIFAPIAISKAITTGVSFGGGLLGSVVGGAGGVAAGGASIAAAAATGGGSAVASSGAASLAVGRNK